MVIDTKKNYSKNQNQEELRNLIKKAQKGCIESRDKVIENNMNLVRNVAKRYQQHRDYEDLMQLGMIGLMKSVEKFDLNTDFCFSTYAVPKIIGEIRRHFRDYKTVKVSRYIQGNLSKIKRFNEEFRLKNLKEPRISDIVKGTGIEEEDVIMAIGADNDYISIDRPIGREEGKTVTLIDVLKDETNDFLHFEDREWIERSMRNLNNRERSIIVSRYMLERTQSELAKTLGISQAHVSRIEKRALKKIKEIV